MDPLSFTLGVLQLASQNKAAEQESHTEAPQSDPTNGTGMEPPDPQPSPNNTYALDNLSTEVHALATQHQIQATNTSDTLHAIQGGQSVVVWFLLACVVVSGINGIVLHLRLSTLTKKLDDMRLDAVRHNK